MTEDEKTVNPSVSPKVLENLRQGAPPYGMSSYFTVGDSGDIQGLESLIGGKGPHLIEAAPGCGKSHLLDHVREKALEQGFIVSLVRLDSEQEIRFNRLDQIVGAVFRALEVPGIGDVKGIRPFMNNVCEAIEDSRFKNQTDEFWTRLTNEWKWDVDIHNTLESPALYVALRAWCHGSINAQSLVEDWLHHPWRYYKDRRSLVRALIEDLRSNFVDPRPPSVLFSNKTRIFHFKEPEYVQSWAALRDIEKLTTAAGYKGFVLLFDEMSDIYDRLGNLKFLKIALTNLFRFLQPEFFDGKSFFAVDTDFERKCRDEFAKKRQGAYDLSRLDQIPRFRMAPLEEGHLVALADKIIRIHSAAYGWNGDASDVRREVNSLVQSQARSVSEHMPRQVVRAVVEFLDAKLEDHS